MTAKRDALDALVKNMALAREFVGEARTIAQLEADPKTLYSLARALEVVGEATKRVPDSVRKLDPAIPWKEIAGMRDRLIHAYENVDVELLLKTVRTRVPEVEPRVRDLLTRVAGEPE
ncbi:MAG: DUF86 domain-containing protein [Gemmatimonadetes bacterium]|nr:DUF86 domain-containing protein [Gemmatimonadota bacterium]